MVWWENVGKVACHPFGKLSFLSPAPENALDGVDLEALRTGPDYVVDQNGLDNYMKTWNYDSRDGNPTQPSDNITRTNYTTTTSTNLSQTTVPTDGATEGATATVTTEQTATSEEASTTTGATPIETIIENTNIDSTNVDSTNIEIDTSEEEAADPDLQEMDDHYNVNELAEELAEDDRTGRHLNQWCNYLCEKEGLMGTTVEVKYGRNRRFTNTWKVVPDVKKEDVPEDREFEKVGISQFDFNDLEVKCPQRNKKRINFNKLLIHFWPGDHKEQLKLVNRRISSDNRSKKQNCRHGRAKQIKRISEREFWKFWGIMLKARIWGRTGNVWDKEEPEGYEPTIDCTNDMTKGRFDDIKKYIAYIFANWDAETMDPWWQVAGGVDGFNENRKKIVMAGFTKVMDELMSAFKPRMTPTGNLPHLSHIQRKPEPFGTEFKATMCATTGVLLFIELQKGKLPMRQAKYCDELRLITAATTLRLIEPTLRKDGVSDTNSTIGEDNNDVPNLFLGDSWFASIEAAANIKQRFNSNFIGVIKTSHAGYCKTFLEEKMALWPAGSHMVLEATVEGGVEMLAIGYKYNKRKVTCFIATKGAGHTEAGVPYEAKWKDDNGNTMSRDIFRPEIVSKYFTKSNKLDVHNQSRQGDLHLEKNWVTNDGFFRIATTLFALTITDAWKAYCFHLPSNHRHKNMKILDFSKILCRDLMENKGSVQTMECEALVLNIDTNSTSGSIPSLVSGDLVTVNSSLTGSEDDPVLSHKCQLSGDYVSYVNEDYGTARTGKRKKRGKCMVCRANTPWVCKICNAIDLGDKRKAAWICNDDVVRPGKKTCLEIHHEHIREQLDNGNQTLDDC